MIKTIRKKEKNSLITTIKKSEINSHFQNSHNTPDHNYKVEHLSHSDNRVPSGTNIFKTGRKNYSDNTNTLVSVSQNTFLTKEYSRTSVHN